MRPELSSYTHVASGKVRDIYDVDDTTLLMVVSDRISAYDFALEPAIPDKGRVLTATSKFFFDAIDFPNHLAGPLDDERIPAECLGRAMVVKKLDMLPFECVARGYLTGSGLKEYQAHGTLWGRPLPEGLADGSRAVLSSDSRIDLAWSRARREVALLQGEAFFEVAKDPGRPFAVEAGARRVVGYDLADGMLARARDEELAELKKNAKPAPPLVCRPSMKLRMPPSSLSSVPAMAAIDVTTLFVVSLPSPKSPSSETTAIIAGTRISGPSTSPHARRRSRACSCATRSAASA